MRYTRPHHPWLHFYRWWCGVNRKIPGMERNNVLIYHVETSEVTPRTATRPNWLIYYCILTTIVLRSKCWFVSVLLRLHIDVDLTSWQNHQVRWRGEYTWGNWLRVTGRLLTPGGWLGRQSENVKYLFCNDWELILSTGCRPHQLVVVARSWEWVINDGTIRTYVIPTRQLHKRWNDQWTWRVWQRHLSPA